MPSTTAPSKPDAAARIVAAQMAHKKRFLADNPQGVYTVKHAAEAVRAQLAIEFPTEPKKRTKLNGCAIPSPDEVTAYFAEIGYPLDGAAWCDSYAQKGWLVGRVPMKDWKAACRNWKRHAWKIDQEVKADASMPASLGALQIQIQTVEDELGRILYPGGAAFKTVPVGKDLERANFLSDQRKKLKARIEALS